MKPVDVDVDDVEECPLFFLKQHPENVDDLESVYAGRMSVVLETVSNIDDATARRPPQRVPGRVTLKVIALATTSRDELRDMFVHSTRDFESAMLKAPVRASDGASTVLFNVHLETPLELTHAKHSPFKSTQEREKWRMNRYRQRRLRALFKCDQYEPVRRRGLATLMPAGDIETLYVAACDAVAESVDELVAREVVPYATDHIVPLAPFIKDSPNVVYGQVRVDTRGGRVVISLVRLLARTSVSWLFSDETFRNFTA